MKLIPPSCQHQHLLLDFQIVTDSSHRKPPLNLIVIVHSKTFNVEKKRDVILKKQTSLIFQAYKWWINFPANLYILKNHGNLIIYKVSV